MKICKERFFEHYMNFLGASDGSALRRLPVGVSIIESNVRDHIFNSFVKYPVIIAEPQAEIIISLSPRYYTTILNQFLNNFDANDIPTMSDIENVVKFWLAKYSSNLKFKTMFKFSTSDNFLAKDTCTATSMTVDMKDIYINSLAADKTLSDKMEKWKLLEGLIKANRCFVMLKQGKIVSMSTVSDVFLGAGNIVVSTFPEQRRKGYGRQVVSAAIDWCLNNNILPIYAVDTENLPSVRLARSICLTQYVKEFVAAGYVC